MLVKRPSGRMDDERDSFTSTRTIESPPLPSDEKSGRRRLLGVRVSRLSSRISSFKTPGTSRGRRQRFRYAIPPEIAQSSQLLEIANRRKIQQLTTSAHLAKQFAVQQEGKARPGSEMDVSRGWWR